MMDYFQNIPLRIDPVALRIGSFSIGWYPLMYIAAFLTVYLLLRWRIRNKEFSIFNFQFSIKSQFTIYNLQNILEEFIVYSFLGVVIGGRLGYVLFYDFPYYLDNLSAVFSPFDEAGKLVGIYGMSYHGGLIGVLLATWYFCRNNKVEFWKWAEFVVPAVPAGFFFGRLGNFLNGELYGRITTQAWGMYFPADASGMLRHPSQLYEAFFEGLVLFLILWLTRNKKYSQNCHPELAEGSNHGKSRFLDFAKASLGMTKEGSLLALYIFLYGFFRFFLEFFREPDPQLGFIIKYAKSGLTMGQILSFGMMILGLIAYVYLRRKGVYNSKRS